MSSLIHKKSKSRSIASLVGAGASLMGPITARNHFIGGEEDHFFESSYNSESNSYDSHSIQAPDSYDKESKPPKYASLDYRSARHYNNTIADTVRQRTSRSSSTNEPPNYSDCSSMNGSTRKGSASSSCKKKSSTTSSSTPLKDSKKSLKSMLEDLKLSYSYERTNYDAFDRGWLFHLGPYIFKFFEWSIIVLLIYFGFNVVYIFLFFLLYSYQIHSSESARKLALFGKMPTEVFLSMIDKESFPAWLKNSDMDRAEWINDIIAQLWPNLSRYSTHFIKAFIEPELIHMLNELQLKDLSGFEIKKVMLGSIPLKIGGCRVFPRGTRSEKEGITFEMELIYSGDARVQFIVQRIAAEIKNISLRGTVRISLKPLLNTFPLIGGCEVTFMQLPIYNYSLGGIGTFADLPGISTLVKSIVDSQIKSRVLWPNKLKILLPIPETEDILHKQKSYISRPFGYLHVQVIEAENLVAKDISMVGKGTSDPYAIVVVNGKRISFQSQYVEKSLNPIWDYACDFILDGDLIPEDHSCEILVYDYDQGTQDDFLGNAVIDLQSVIQMGEFDNWVPLTNIKKGKVHLKLKFRECSSALNTTGDYIIYIYIESCSNLTNDNGGPLTSPIECLVNNTYVISQRGQTNSDDRVHHVDDCITFYTTVEEDLSVVVRDKKSGSDRYGDYRLSISDLINNFDGEITNEVLPLNYHSDSKMVVSIKLFSLVEQ